MENNQKNIAVIGAGYWGKNLVRNFHELNRLAVICDSDPERLQALSANYPSIHVETAYPAVLMNPSIAAVAIATPAESHGELVKKALLANKDVLVEKPLCLSEQEGKELVAVAKKQQRILMVGHLLWYHPAVLTLKELVESGELGRIQYIYSNRLNLGQIRREENILWSFAPHDISVILGLINERPESIRAQGGNYLHHQIADVTVSLLSFPSGVKAHIFVSWLHPFKEQKLVVVGDRKMAVFNDLEKKDKLLLFPHSIDWKGNIPVASKADAQVVEYEHEEPLRAECIHFLDCVQSRNTPRTDGEEGVKVLTVLQRCQEALEKDWSRQEQQAQVIEKNFFAHTSAFVDDGVEIGAGTTIWHSTHILTGTLIGENCKIGQNVVVGPNVTVGKGVKIQNNVSVYEGVTLEDFVFCGPSMVFTNVFNPRSEVPRMTELMPTLVKQGATLGANSTILCGITIGQYAFIGAGAVVLRDVPAFALLVGNPARQIGWMCRCGNKLIHEESNVWKCHVCQDHYFESDLGLIRHVDQSGQRRSGS
ncbi:MAG: oxidoreductase [Nitrospirales bacterium]|nr:MAG: oxidoreductase [Nitrospirales bacterium]